jgi:imidazoleglycerol-phosphate dehydratase/histidinol-phosphatase
MLLHYLRDRKVDIENSAVVGDRPTDLQLAANLGCRGYRVGPGHYDWAGLARELVGLPRRARVDRATRETTIRVDIDLDRPGEPAVATGIGFFDHLLEQLGKHGGFALSVSCTGDLHVDGHHTVEDCGLAIGQALRRALGGKHGVERYGQATDDGRLASITLPMDEARASAVLDLAGRPWFAFDGRFSREAVGGLATEMVPHFFRSMCDSAGFTLHLAMRGENAHHQAEACFKAVGRALRQAMRRDGSDVPSTKGAL